MLFLLTGCAHQPWGGLVDEQRSASLIGGYEKQRQEQWQGCTDRIDGDVVLHWQTAVDDVSLSGYFQTMNPSYIKFSVTNPLGQPQLVLAANAKSYQILNVYFQTVYFGSMRSYAMRSGVPLPFLNGPWFAWLSGRLMGGNVKVVEVRSDEDNRGIWYAVAYNVSDQVPMEYILLDAATGTPLERVIVDEEGDSLARIVYADWRHVERCPMPMDITVTGLTFWAEAHLALHDVRAASLSTADFKVPVPAGYMKQYRP